MTPLIVVKINAMISRSERLAAMEEIADGIQKGALVIAGPGMEIIAFDSEGRLVYPIREVAP